MKKLITVILSLILTLSCVACLAGCGSPDKEALLKEYSADIEKEMKGSFDFFWNEAQTDESKPTYGLIVDRWPKASTYASIASVGFGLTAYVIGVEEGWVTKAEAEQRSLKTLKTLEALQNNGTDVTYEGCFAHFINMNTGARHNNSEISTIDTAILICGAITAGEYFGGEVKEAANAVYSNVNWTAFRVGGNRYISMGVNPATGSQLGRWDQYAEQLMMYVVGAGSPNENYRLDDKEYYAFTRQSGAYGDGEKFIYSWFGSIFTYQFSHAWINFEGIVDKDGTDWYANSVNASKAAYEYCMDRKNESANFKNGGWGLTACDTAGGYSGKLGATPRGWNVDGMNEVDSKVYESNKYTVAPCGAIGSVVFTPEESLKALRYYQSISQINGKYGLTDAFDLNNMYYATDCIGIDKGISIAMLANFKSDTVWNIFMNNDSVKLGLKNLGFAAK